MTIFYYVCWTVTIVAGVLSVLPLFYSSFEDVFPIELFVPGCALWFIAIVLWLVYGVVTYWS